jgi:hypothetical protein
MTSQGLKPPRNAGLSSLARENLDSGHFELFNFPGRCLLRPAFLAGIKLCDVIMYKVYSFTCIATMSLYDFNLITLLHGSEVFHSRQSC